METLQDYTTKRFGLFQGKRSHPEDLAILESLEKACIEETFLFIEENLDPKDQEAINNSLDTYDLLQTSNETLFQDIISFCEKNLPDIQEKLSEHLEEFLEQVADRIIVSAR